MRRFVFLLFTLLASMTMQAKTRVSDKPAFASTSTSDLLPVKVEHLKKKTVVHFRMNCAHRRNWSMVGARLECEGRVYKYISGRLITHDGPMVLSDEAFEIGKEYDKNPMQDSLILTFEPLPKKTVMFDYIEGDNSSSWKIYGIRLDGKLHPFRLPAYKKPENTDEPLKPLTLTHGKAKATIRVHGGSVVGYFGDSALNPLTGDYEDETVYEDSVTQFCHPAFMPMMPQFIGHPVDPSMGRVDQFWLYIIPGETLTLDIDAAACVARVHDFAAGKPAPSDCYRVGGSIGDINQVVLENMHFIRGFIKEIPVFVKGETYAQWCDKVWACYDSLRQDVLKKRDYTQRQKDMLQLMVDNIYLATRMSYEPLLQWLIGYGNDISDVIAEMKKTQTFVDPHAKDLMLYRDGRSFYLPLNLIHLPYLEANGMDKGEVYDMMKAYASAKVVGDKLRAGEVQPDSIIQSVHPYFQQVLKVKNDSVKMQLERLKREAADRMKPTPDATPEEMLNAIAAQYPGKAVFMDCWATWCVPCMKGIEAMEPMKEQMKGLDVVFVYLTNETSQMDAWSEQVIRIPGQHYRIKSDIWNKIPGLGAIPQYYLYDRQGKRVWETTGFGKETLKEIETEINRVLEQ